MEHRNGHVNESNEEREGSSEEIEKNTKDLLNKTSPWKSKISDRIQFEEDVETNGHVSDTSDVTESKKLRHYLKSNPHLRLVSTREVNTIISKDDDVWILHCPQGVGVSQLENSDISIDEKCKMKIDSQTFHGNLDTDFTSIAVLDYHRMKPVIKKLSIEGTVHFRKKIPRPHFIEDNTMVNNQTNFIPLPDTKCRHPFFGPDYKRAMKIRTSVKARLKAVENEEIEEDNSEMKRKKKHKKEKIDLDEVDIKTEIPRKKRKRPDTDEDEPVPKKSKKIKHDPDKVWESEEAIKESLFNF